MQATRRRLLGAALTGSAVTGTAITASAVGVAKSRPETDEVRPDPARPRRIVSLGACLDAILLAVADADQIKALSRYSRDPETSTVVAEAAAFDVVGDSAEEVMHLQPDLILASRRTGLHTRTALTRLGLELSAFPSPETIEKSLEQIATIAGLVGHPERGEALIRRIEDALDTGANAAGEGAPRPLTLIYQNDGLCPGAGTLMDELMTRMGLTNAAARYGVRNWGRASLEQVLADPPDLLLLGEKRHGATSRLDDSIVTHPALRSLQGRMIVQAFPARLLYCAGPTLIASSAIMAEARLRAISERVAKLSA
ncbi:ABC transporter substrate-binding protein [Brevundimonas diminuta]|uniref:ABC transporter substrate-binding protein n=1 Tax=Brevundimonas diminuta TaxID=293 RepID=UPI003D06E13A